MQPSVIAGLITDRQLSLKSTWDASTAIVNAKRAQTARGSTMKAELTIDLLLAEAKTFAKAESKHGESTLYGVSDGKAVGTYLEHKFVSHLMAGYSFASGNSAKGIDIPSVNVDIKVTSIRQPQSSSPFKSARQKIFGLGYHLIVFVYEKTDDAVKRTARLDIQHTIFVHQDRTADYQMTKGLIDILDRDGNEDDIVAFMQDRFLPVDDIEAHAIACQVIMDRPKQGYLTISNALQWRLQYARAIARAGDVAGLIKVV